VGFAEMAASFMSGGTAGAMKSAAKRARVSGGRKGLVSLARALRTSVVKMRQKAMQLTYVRKQLRQFSADVRDRIVEGGATLLLASNLPTDYGTLAREIAAAVDPTGVISFFNSFVPPKSCEEGNVVTNDVPKTNDGKPDLDPLDLTNGRWGGAWTQPCAATNSCGKGRDSSATISKMAQQKRDHAEWKKKNQPTRRRRCYFSC